MKNTMRTTAALLALVLLMTCALAGCGKQEPTAEPAPTTTPEPSPAPATPEPSPAPVTEPDPAPTTEPEPEPAPAPEPEPEPAPEPTPETAPRRADGERFQAVIQLEGMDEPVEYEHMVNDTIGFEMDYDYELFQRMAAPDTELILSVYDGAKDPLNYLEITYSPSDPQTVAANITARLSQEYEVSQGTLDLAEAGECLTLDASEVKGGGFMPEFLQKVYIIPANDGTIVATAHYVIESAEGIGRRFQYMLHTLVVTEAHPADGITDARALDAIVNYCYAQDPDLKAAVESGEYPIYWDVSSSDADEVVILYRTATGALIRYYIDRTTGATTVTEAVPGLIDETRTEESFNINDYMR